MKPNRIASQSNSSHPSQPQRRGSATVEFAVAIPLLVLLIFGSIEACNSIYLKQAVTEAAYEGALVAMKPGAAETDVTTRINAVLQSREITGANIVVANGNLSTVDAGEQFTIDVSLSAGSNQVGPSVVSTLTSVSSTVTAVKQ